MRPPSERVLVSDINVTPLVDVMLVLLIIFMVTAPLLDRGIPVELPHAVTSRVAPSEGVTITLTKEHIVYLNKDIVTMKELRQRLAAFAGQPVLIQADRNAYVSRLVELWDLCRQQGLHQVHIVTITD